MRFIKKICLLLAVILILPVCACKDTAVPVTFTSFNTQIIIAGQSKPITKKVENQIKDLFSSLENEFDLSLENSFTDKFNQANNGETIQVSNTALEILTAAKTVYEKSSGKFDPTVYPLVSLWKFAPYSYTPNFEPPSDAQIEQERQKVDFDLVTINAENNIVKKENEDVKLDLGGIVKGYAADKAAEILSQNGYNDGYVSVGGSSLYLLKVKELGVRHPRNVNDVIITVNCNDKTNLSVSTSGDYEKYHVSADGTRYCHIIDPITGFSANTGIASATLMGVEGVKGDALTTALCLCKYDKNNADNELIRFLTLIKSDYPDCMIFVVYNNGTDKLLITNKTQDVDFVLRDTDYKIVTI